MEIKKEIRQEVAETINETKEEVLEIVDETKKEVTDTVGETVNKTMGETVNKTLKEQVKMVVENKEEKAGMVNFKSNRIKAFSCMLGGNMISAKSKLKDHTQLFHTEEKSFSASFVATLPVRSPP